MKLRMFRNTPGLVRCRLSKIRFPEMCPVCLREPDDLVPIAVTESVVEPRAGVRITGSKWAPSEVDIVQLRDSGAVFWVPVCGRHAVGLRTSCTMAVGILGIVVLFYPMLYYVLAVLRAFREGGDLFFAALPLVLLTAVLAGLMAYSFMPRALERAISFPELKRERDLVTVRIRNLAYLSEFLELNSMHADVVGDDTG